jgi:pimeloyl-ACP methyl ester carboxylesterase
MIKSISYKNHQVKCYIEGNGAAVVLLHGWPSNAKLWDPQVEALKANYKTITLDWLGFGASDKPMEHNYTFTAQKEILDTVIAKLLEDEEKLSIIGHDIGGPPALLWASENENRVEHLVLLNTIFYPFKTPVDALSEFALNTPGLSNAFVSDLGLKQVMRTMVKKRGKATRERVKAILEANQDVPVPIKWRTIAEPLNVGRQQEIPTLSNSFKTLKVKKHLLMAKSDPLCYAHIKKLSEENPEVPAHLIPDCGHMIPIDQPDALNALLWKILVG